MAITFLQKRRLERYLILVFIVILLISVFILWRGFGIKEPSLPEEAPIRPQKEVKVNFEILESQFLKELELFEGIKPFEETKLPEEKVGRENPFLAY